MDIKLDPITGELDLTGGRLNVTTGMDEKRQRIDMMLQINLGEWFAGINYGLPYFYNKNEDLGTSFRYFVGQKAYDQAVYVNDQLDRYISRISFVKDLDSSYTFNQETRSFVYNFTVHTYEGEEISFPPFNQSLN